MWLTILIIAIIIGGLWGYFSSDEGERTGGAIGGAVTGGMGCAYVLLQIFIWGLGIIFMIWLFGTLFG